MKKNKKIISLSILLIALIGIVYLYIIIYNDKDTDNSIDNITNQTSGEDTSSGTTGTENNSSNAVEYSSSNSIVLNNEKTVTISKGGNYSISGTLSNGVLIVNTTEKVNIELNNVSITNSSGPAIEVDNAKKITISLKDGTNNTLTDGGASTLNAALFSNDTLVIEGTGSLTINGNNGHGIESDDDIIVNSGNITINSKKDGIHANDNVTINNGTINIKSSSEGIECKDNDIIINGGTIVAYTSDDGINAAKNITINGGNIYVQSTSNDGIDSNGTINITGGIIVAVGAGGAECGIDSDNTPPVITGGTLLAVGGAASTPDSSTSTQYTVRMGVTPTNGIISLKSGDDVIFTFKCSQSYSTVLYSSPLLKKSGSYSIYKGGSISGGTDFYGYSTDSTYTEGTKSGTFSISSIVTLQGGSAGPGGGNGNAGARR